MTIRIRISADALIEATNIAAPNNGKIISIEPDPENLEVLKENIELNGFSNIDIIEKAVSNKKTIGKFYLTRWSGMRSLNSPQNNSKSISVDITTLDDILKEEEKIDLMKIDVEEEEVNVLKGAKLSMPKIRNIMIECHNSTLKDEVESLLVNHYFIEEIDSEDSKRFWLFCSQISHS